MAGFLAILATISLATLVAAQEHVSFATQDGGLVFADMYGNGNRGVVLAHGGRSPSRVGTNRPKFLPRRDFASWPSTSGATGSPTDRAIGHLYCPTAPGRPRRGAVFKKIRAKTVSVVGGSLGGGAAADAAIEADQGEIGRVVLIAAPPGARPEKLKGRKLLIIARDDADGTGPRLPRIRTQWEKVPEPKEILILDGSAHAQFLFETDQGERVIQKILEFLSAP